MRNYKLFLLAAFGLMLVFTNCSKEYALDPVIVVTPKPVKLPTGEFVVAPSGYRNGSTGILAVYDKAGNMIKQIETGSTTMDFKKWELADGTIRYTYLKYDKTVPHMPNVGYNAGQIIVLDQNFAEINSLTLLPYGDRTAADNNALDGHDFILISDNHFISMA